MQQACCPAGQPREYLDSQMQQQNEQLDCEQQQSNDEPSDQQQQQDEQLDNQQQQSYDLPDDQQLQRNEQRRGNEVTAREAAAKEREAADEKQLTRDRAKLMEAFVRDGMPQHEAIKATNTLTQREVTMDLTLIELRARVRQADYSEQVPSKRSRVQRE